MSWQSVTLAGPEPISVAEAKLHLRVVDTADDALITAQIVAAREEAQLVCRRLLAPQTIRLSYTTFPTGWMRIEPGPVTAVTSITYKDASGASVAVDLASVEIVPGTPGWARPKTGAWPAVTSRPDGVVIVYSAGYTLATLPAPYRQAMLLIVGDWYENRERAIVGQGNSAVSLPAARNLLLMDRYTE